VTWAAKKLLAKWRHHKYGAQSIEQKSLREILLSSIMNNRLNEHEKGIISDNLEDDGQELSDLVIILSLLSEKNQNIRQLLKPWIINHIKQGVTVEFLKSSINYDIYQELVAEFTETDVQKFAKKVFDFNDLELDMQLATCLLGDDTTD
jgi:sugar-specific transcriptional regulator TrmB